VPWLRRQAFQFKKLLALRTMEGEAAETEEDSEPERQSWVDGLLRYRFRRRTYVLADPRGVLVHGTGTSVWSAGEVLADLVAANPTMCGPGPCLELGAGVGVVGITLAFFGVRPIVLTDLDRQLPLLRRNASENFQDPGVLEVAALDWRIPEERESLAPWKGRWSAVLASDVGYDPDLFEPLRQTLLAQCGETTPIFLALADRDEEDEPGVDELVEAFSGSFRCEEIHTRRLYPHQSVTRVLRMTRCSVDLPTMGEASG